METKWKETRPEIYHYGFLSRSCDWCDLMTAYRKRRLSYLLYILLNSAFHWQLWKLQLPKQIRQLVIFFRALNPWSDPWAGTPHVKAPGTEISKTHRAAVAETASQSRAGVSRPRLLKEFRYLKYNHTHDFCSCHQKIRGRKYQTPQNTEFLCLLLRLE